MAASVSVETLSAATATRGARIVRAGSSTRYVATLNAAGLAAINRSGLTQMRLYFALDDNNDLSADYLKFVSGDSSVNPPQLLVSYSVP